MFFCLSYKEMFKILPNYALPHFNIPGPFNSACLLDPSLLTLKKMCWFWVQLRLACLLVLNWFWDFSMPFLEGFVLSMQTVLQTTLEPVVESGISGVTFVCVVFLHHPPPSTVLVFLLSCQREHYFCYSRTWHSLHSKLCLSLDLYMGWTQASLMPDFSRLSSKDRNISHFHMPTM